MRSASFVSTNPAPTTTTTSTVKTPLKKAKKSRTKNEEKMDMDEELEENNSEENESNDEKPGIVKMKPRYMHQSYTIYTNVLLRVTSTCGEYLDLKREKRRAITEKSRLFYVKRELDWLDPLEEEKFKTYIEAYREIVYRTKRPKHPEKATETSTSTPTDGIVDESNTKTKKDGTPMYITDTTKKTVRQFLMIHDEFGKLLHGLIMEFLNPDNLDYQDYLAQQKKDKSIKQACKNRSKAASRTILALTMSLDRTRKHYANIFVKKPTKDLSK